MLKGLKITEQSYGDEDFNASILLCIILFETQDHRKGAILVKKFVRDGRNSYVIVDIKVQRNDSEDDIGSSYFYIWKLNDVSKF